MSRYLASVREVAAALGGSSNIIACRTELELDAAKDEYVLTVAFSAESLSAVELHAGLQRVVDAANLRGIAARYDINPDEILARINKEK